MKKGWQTKTLGEVCPISNRKPEAFAGTRRYFSTGAVGSEGELSEPELVDYANRPSRAGCMPEVGDIGFARMKGTKKVILIDESLKGALFSTGFCFVAPRPNVEPRFAFYFVTSDDFQEAKNGVAGDGIMGGIKNSDAAAMGMPLPPLAEQQRIVGLLDEAFEGLATAKANAEKNIQNVRALFESHLQSVFTQRDPGWVEKRLGDEALLEIIDGDRGVNYPNGSDFQDEGYCLFMNTKNVRPDGFEFESTMFITEEKDRLLRKGKLKRDDVVLTTRGTIGNVGIYSEDVPFDNIRINSGMLIFRPNKSALLPAFLFELFRSEIVKDQIRKQTTGAAQPQLPIKTLVNFTIPVPTNLADQAALVKKLRAYEPETQRLSHVYERKLAALEALKKSLLHQAFTGAL